MVEPAPQRFNMARYCVGPGLARRPDHVGLVVVHDPLDPLRGAERWTYAELHEAVTACAAGLLAHGIRPGERLVLRMGNTSDYALLFFGAIAAGIIAVPTSAQLTAEEVGFVLSDSGATALAVSAGLDVDTDLPRVAPDDVARWRRSGERPAYLAGGYADTDAEQAAFMVYTSGTTGVPKGVLHAQRSAWGRRPMYAGWYGIGADDVVLHAGAFNWTYTLGTGLTDPWANGATAVIYDGERDPAVWSRIIAATGATMFAAVPGVFRQLLARGQLDRRALRTMRHGLTAGEALTPALWTSWRETTGTELYEALGMSEISTFVSSGPGVPTRPGSPGRPQPGRRVAVLPVEGGTDPLPAGERGLLAVHGSDPGLMLEYWNRPQEQAEAFRGDWFVSGDLVHLDEDGYIVHHGRTDDVMTSMGYRVSPLEVERCLAQHPAVADVAVTEVAVRDGVNIITAFVVPTEPGQGSLPDPAVLIAHTRAHLAAYKCPREVVFVRVLPRTPNGKILRRKLREGAAAG
ncbi:MAG: class I adenylate-forming enzyme family protein [Dermatophilaceae bacterium]